MTSSRAVPYTPNHEEDEPLYGYLGRVYAHNFACPTLQFLHLIFGLHKAVSSADLPSNLVEMLRRWPEVSPFPDIQDLIEKTTHYPYHRLFLTNERWGQLMERAVSGPGGSLKIWLGLVAQRFAATATFRSCIECDRLSWDSRGVLHWHRAHMLPGVLICPIHRTPLIAHHVQSHDTARNPVRLPPLPGTPLRVSRENFDALARFASASSAALWTSSARSLTGDYCARTYLARLRDLGISSPSGSVDLDQLSKLVLADNNGFRGWEIGPRITHLSGNALCWLYELFRDRGRACHPLTHIILINSLFGSIDAYAQAARDLISREDSAERHAELEPSAHLDVLANPILLDRSLNCRSAAAHLGISVTTVVKRRRIAGVPVVSRRKVLTSVRLGAVKEMLSSGLPPAQVSSITKLALCTVYRIRAEMRGPRSREERQIDERLLAAYRSRWLNTALSGRSVRQRRVLDGASYAWLYRNDRQWLTEGSGHCAPVFKVARPRIDWNRRDQAYSKRITATSADLRGRSSRGRVSRTLLLRAAGPESSIRSNLQRLPLTRRALEACAESVSEFQRMRYSQAMASLANLDEPLMAWRLLKLAGLRRLPST